MSNIEVRVEPHKDIADADLYGKTAWYLARDFLSYAMVLSDILVIMACGALSDLFLSRELSFQPDFSKVSIVACVFYILILRIIGSYPVSSDIDVSNAA